MRSAFCSAPTAATVPCIPGMPRCCGCLSGNAPLAISVVTTGIPVSSASSRSCAAARALITPPPTYSTGRLASLISRAASRTCLACGLVTGWYPGRSNGTGQLNSVVACMASLAMSTSTGPGRPVKATWNASPMVRAMSPALVTRKLCLVIGMVIPEMSASWKPSVPIRFEDTWPVIATIGTESM